MIIDAVHSLGRNGLVGDPPELGRDRLDRLVGAGDVDAGLREERARVGVAVVQPEDVVRKPAALAHLGEEPRRHAAAEHRREDRAHHPRLRDCLQHAVRVDDDAGPDDE